MALPFPDRVLMDHIAILGKTGSGKTSAGKAIIEHVVAEDYRVCILDPIKSDWWGLTSSADGKKPGLPFKILGGPRGHVPLAASTGSAIAQVVADGRLPLSIIDMAFFDPGEHARFFIDFSKTLMRKMKGVVYLVLEEAHTFVPKERAGIGNENMSIYWGKQLATAGRTKGLRLMALTQRTQKLHNDVLGSCETMIALRLRQPADQKPVKDWLKDNAEGDLAKQVSNSLSSLKNGEAWVCAGEAGFFQRVAFPRITTFDNSATPTGDADEVSVVTAPIAIEALRNLLSDATAEAALNDPKELRGEITRLQAEIRTLKSSLSSSGISVEDEKLNMLHQKEVRTAFSQGETSGFNKGREAIGNLIGPQFEDICRYITDIKGLLSRKIEELPEFVTSERPQSFSMDGEHYPDTLKVKPSYDPAGAPKGMHVRPLYGPKGIVPEISVGVAPEGLGKPETAVLRAVTFWASVGEMTPTRAQVAAVAGYKANTGNFRAIIGKLVAQGHLAIAGTGHLKAGVPMIGMAKMTRQQAQTTVQNVLSGPAAKIFSAALQTPMGIIHRNYLAGEAGYQANTGNFRAVIGELVGLDLLRKASIGTVQVSPWAADLFG